VPSRARTDTTLSRPQPRIERDRRSSRSVATTPLRPADSGIPAGDAGEGVPVGAADCSGARRRGGSVRWIKRLKRRWEAHAQLPHAPMVATAKRSTTNGTAHLLLPTFERVLSPTSTSTAANSRRLGPRTTTDYRRAAWMARRLPTSAPAPPSPP
jgi:hypothetical protein